MLPNLNSGDGKIFSIGLSLGLLIGISWNLFSRDPNATNSASDRSACATTSSSDGTTGKKSIAITERNSHRKQSYNTPSKSGGRDPKTIEICLDDITSAIEAKSGSTSAVELCVSRVEGGVTPSIGLVEECVELFRDSGIEVHVLVRPRPGGFVYSQQEFDVILRDILTVKAAGVTGVVVGILLSDGTIDIDRMRVVRKITEGIQLTFHRAFDVCTDPDQALEAIVELGCDRLLTSAQCGVAADSLQHMRRLVNKAAGRIRVIAASGISAENVSRIILNTGVDGVHAGSSVVETVSEVSPSTFSSSEDLGSDSHPHASSSPSALSSSAGSHIHKHPSVELLRIDGFDTVIRVSRSKVQRLAENARLAWGILAQRGNSSTPRLSRREMSSRLRQQQQDEEEEVSDDSGDAGAGGGGKSTSSSANFLGSFGFNRKFRGDDIVNSGANSQVIANIVAAGGNLRDFEDTLSQGLRSGISRAASLAFDGDDNRKKTIVELLFADSIDLEGEEYDNQKSIGDISPSGASLSLPSSPTTRSAWSRRMSLRRSVTLGRESSLVVHASSDSISVESSYVNKRQPGSSKESADDKRNSN